MYPLKISTAITVPVFAHDANGDAVAGLVDGGFTKRISKNGGAFGAMTVTITEMEGGWYSMPIGTGHSNTAGILSISLTHGSCKQINVQFRVHSRIFDNLAFPTDDGQSLDINGTGNVGLDFANYSGTLAKGTQLTNFNDLSAAQVNAEVDTALNTAIPGGPTANSINERLATMDDAYTAARGAFLEELAAANLPADVDTLLTRVTAAVALASVCTEGRLAELDGANLITDVANNNTALSTLTTRLSALRAGYLDELAAANLPADIAALPTTAEVNAEVVDCLNTDTYVEPVQGTPPATASLAAKIGQLYKNYRNRKTTTSTQESLYNDDALTVDHKSALSDDGTTFSKGEVIEP